MDLDFKKHTIYASDPFAVEPLPQAHYFPSPERRLDARQRKTAISPSRRLEDRGPRRQGDDERVSPMDECFLKGTNSLQYETRDSHINNQDIDFDESWPTSEKPSSLSLTGIVDDSPIDFARYQTTLEKFAGLKKAFNFLDEDKPDKAVQTKQAVPLNKPATNSKTKAMQEKTRKSKIPTKGGSKTSTPMAKHPPATKADPGEGSVLSKYVERFRNSAPMSREERDKRQAGSQSEFWWMSGQGTNGKATSPEPSGGQTEQPSSDEVIPLTEVNLDKFGQKFYYSGYTGHKDIPPSPGDQRTRELQERADRLLERSSSSVVSTDPAVSTEGLGSNMSEMSSLDEYAHRPKFASYLEKDERPAANPYGASRRQNPRPQPAPERGDDPLQQWRLRRRMEQAQQGAPTHAEAFNFITKTEQQKQIEAKLEEFKRKLTGTESQPSLQSMQQTSSYQPSSQGMHRTSSSQSSTQGMHRTSSYQFTPAPATKKTEVTVETGHHSRSTSEPQIASPLLHKQKPLREVSDVDPHLHLMCDLLPCPHQQKYQEQLSKERGNKNIEAPSKFENFDKGGNKYSPREETSNESLYKQYLEAEKPDIDKDEEVNRVKTDGRVPESRLKDDKGQEKDDLSHGKPQEERKHNVVHKKSGSQRGVISDESVTEDIPRKQRVKANAVKPDAVPSSDSDPEQGKPARKERMPKPTGSSSPKVGRRNLDKAIGQVVKNHLFSMSTSTVLSSVESLPPSVSVERLPRKPQKPDISAVDEVDENEGSDNEFPDDNLLHMLRRQRDEYEQQLKEIDEQISHLEST